MKTKTLLNCFLMTVTFTVLAQGRDPRQKSFGFYERGSCPNTFRGCQREQIQKITTLGSGPQRTDGTIAKRTS